MCRYLNTAPGKNRHMQINTKTHRLQELECRLVPSFLPSCSVTFTGNFPVELRHCVLREQMTMHLPLLRHFPRGRLLLCHASTQPLPPFLTAQMTPHCSCHYRFTQLVLERELLERRGGNRSSSVHGFTY